MRWTGTKAALGLLLLTGCAWSRCPMGERWPAPVSEPLPLWEDENPPLYAEEYQGPGLILWTVRF